MYNRKRLQQAGINNLHFKMYAEPQLKLIAPDSTIAAGYFLRIYFPS